MCQITQIAITIALLLACFVVPTGAEDENARLRQPQKKPPTDETDAGTGHHPVDPVAEELAEIRRAITGETRPSPSLPTLPSLPGEKATNDPLNSSQFSAAVTRIAAAQPPATESVAVDAGAAQPDRPLLPDRAPSPSSATVSALRDAAWRLDQAANALERVDLYHRADTLRHQAAELRIQARQLQSRLSGPPRDLVDTSPPRR